MSDGGTLGTGGVPSGGQSSSGSINAGGIDGVGGTGTITGGSTVQGGTAVGTVGNTTLNCPGISKTPLASAVPFDPKSKWYRVLYIVKSNVDAKGFHETMSDADIDAARTALGTTFPKMVIDHTNGLVAVDPTVIVMPRVVTSTSRERNATDRPGVWPVDMPAADLQEYWGTFAQGYYDQVQNYNAIREFQYVNSGWFETDASVSWTVLNRRADLGYDKDALAGAWHEWLHGWETYYWGYSQLPTTNPDSCVHCGEACGYNANSNQLTFWIGWYRDLAIGTNGLGFGPKAWEPYGTPRSRFEEKEPSLTVETVRIEARHSSRLLSVKNASANATLQQGAYGIGTNAEE